MKKMEGIYMMHISEGEWNKRVQGGERKRERSRAEER